jgi:hypothetical protein
MQEKAAIYRTDRNTTEEIANQIPRSTQKIKISSHLLNALTKHSQTLFSSSYSDSYKYTSVVFFPIIKTRIL